MPSGRLTFISYGKGFVNDYFEIFYETQRELENASKCFQMLLIPDFRFFMFPELFDRIFHGY